MPTPLKIAIVGAGMAGLSCATVLDARGHATHLFDKGRGPGGRMSTRRVRVGDIEVGFDHGAQYFTVREPSFRLQVKTWQKEGLVAPWPQAGDDAWVGAPAMNAPVAGMASRLQVRFSSPVERLVRAGTGWQLQGPGLDSDTYDAVIVAVPAEQVAPLIIDHCPGFALSAKVTPSEPCWTVMAAYDRTLAIESDILRSNGDIIWAARNSSKPGRAAMETWVIQASPDWSRRNKGAPPSDVSAALLTAFSKLSCQNLPMPAFAQAHSWLYARSGDNGYGYLWDKTAGLGVCGDWLLGPRVECAWLSGHALAKALISSERNSAPDVKTSDAWPPSYKS